MKIRTKLRVLGGITVTGLLIIAAATVWGLNTIQSTEDTAHRRENYVADLLEVKASAAATIMLDPALPETKEVFTASSQNIERNGRHAVDLIRRAEVREALAGILKHWEQYRDSSLKLLATAANDPKAANEELVRIYNQQFKPLQAELDGFIAQRREESAQGVAAAQAVSSKVFWIVIGLLAVGITLTTLAILAVSVSLQSSLKGILQQLVPLSQGDLTQRLPNKGQDELDEVADKVNAFVAELQSIVQRTRDRSQQLSGAAEHLSSAANGVLQATSQQNDATSSVAASVEEFSVSIDQVADNASQAEQRAQQSGVLSRQGGEDVHRAVADIQRVAQVVNDATSQMQALGQQAQDISSIVQVIKDVADQTNLLALNAAIEADGQLGPGHHRQGGVRAAQHGGGIGGDADGQRVGDRQRAPDRGGGLVDAADQRRLGGRAGGDHRHFDGAAGAAHRRRGDRQKCGTHRPDDRRQPRIGIGRVLVGHATGTAGPRSAGRSGALPGLSSTPMKKPLPGLQAGQGLSTFYITWRPGPGRRHLRRSARTASTGCPTG